MQGRTTEGKRFYRTISLQIEQFSHEILIRLFCLAVNLVIVCLINMKKKKSTQLSRVNK